MEKTDPGPDMSAGGVDAFRDPELWNRLAIWIPVDHPLEPVPSRLRAAAVLLPFQYRAGAWVLYFIKRSERVEHHRGQMAFPGGEVEARDRDVVSTALRETYEEIGLPPDHVRVLGRLPAAATVTRYWIYPVAGVVVGPWTPRLSDEEVEALVAVPLAHFLDPHHYQQEFRTWQGRSMPVHVFRYGPYRIWGATARILDELLRRLARPLGLDLSWLPRLRPHQPPRRNRAPEPTG